MINFLFSTRKAELVQMSVKLWNWLNKCVWTQSVCLLSEMHQAQCSNLWV